jgi:hypothetical protein
LLYEAVIPIVGSADICVAPFPRSPHPFKRWKNLQMSKSAYYHRTVKIQISSNAPRGGMKAKIVIPVHIQREAAIEAGSFMAWRECPGKILCTPVQHASLSTSTVFAGGREQLYCGFPGVFWRKYDIAKGTLFHWEVKAGKVRGFLEVQPVSKRTLPDKRSLRARDKGLERTQAVHLLRSHSRLRVNIPAEFCRLVHLKPGDFMRWEETPQGIHGIPTRFESLNTTVIEQRKAGMQVEIPKLLSEKYSLQGGACTWTLQKGKLVGEIGV